MKCINLKRKFSVILILIATFQGAVSAETFKYNELLIKDYDEMSDMVSKLLADSETLRNDESGGDETAANDKLREALRLIYSRPNSDNMVAKLTPEVRKQVLMTQTYEQVAQDLAHEAIHNLKDEKAAASVRATAFFMLENILSELRPEIGQNEKAKAVVESIRDAKLKVPEAVDKELRLRGMFKLKNPSLTAKEILKK